jgi:predicted metalloprotease with PDZ domain
LSVVFLAEDGLRLLRPLRSLWGLRVFAILYRPILQLFGRLSRLIASGATTPNTHFSLRFAEEVCLKPACLVVALILAAGTLLSGQTSVRYTLAMPYPQTHLFEAAVEFSDLPPDTGLDLILPAWRPGRYVVLNLANGVQDFAASGDGHELPWIKTDKSTWHVSSGGAVHVTVRYRVFADELSLRTRCLNDDHAFVDESAVFMYAEKYRKLPVRLDVKPFGNWHVTTGLEADGGNRFTAPDDDTFIDCPMEIGNQKDFAFAVDGVPHVLSIFGDGNWNADTLVRDISKIVKTMKDFWGEFPYRRFVFLLECLPDEGGGTEHLNSVIMQTSPFVFKKPDSYRGFITGLVAHEYFHAWNVKQLRPRGIAPYNFTKENYSRELWIAEGMTSYYADLLSVRAGFIPVADLVSQLGGTVTADRQRPGNAVQPVSEASFNAWIGGTRHSYNSESDIYQRGAMVSMVLDCEIRRVTLNASSLDAVMREMYKRYPLAGGGYTLDDFEHVITEQTHNNFHGFFEEYIRGTKPLKWEEALGAAGINVTCTDTVDKAWAGVGLYETGGSVRVGSVVSGSPAEAAGLSSDDELIALNGYRIRQSSFSDRIGEMKPGDTALFSVFRNEKLRTIQVVLGKAPHTNYTTSKVKEPTPLQKTIFESWLGTSWSDITKK